MKILVIGPAWIGDMVMAQSLLILLKQRDPAAQIDVMVPELLTGLVTSMDEVNQAIASHCGHGEFGLFKRLKMGKQLRSSGYDQAYILPNSFKSALIPFFAGIPKRTGWLGEQRYGVLNDIKHKAGISKHSTLKYYAALACADLNTLPDPLPQPHLKIDPHQHKIVLAGLNLTRPKAPLLIICPGAEFGPAKQWPLRYFVQVAKAKIAQGWRVWLLGSPKDQTVANAIATQVGEGCENLAGRTDLLQAMTLLSLADAVLCHDSGLMHISLALQKPVVTVFGPTGLGRTPTANQRFMPISLALSCSPCFKRECPLKHHRCMEDLLPAKVLHALTILAPKKSVTV